jgi:hypothetical protein
MAMGWSRFAVLAEAETWFVIFENDGGLFSADLSDAGDELRHWMLWVEKDQKITGSFCQVVESEPAFHISRGGSRAGDVDLELLAEVRVFSEAALKFHLHRFDHLFPNARILFQVDQVNRCIGERYVAAIPVVANKCLTLNLGKSGICDECECEQESRHCDGETTKRKSG